MEKTVYIISFELIKLSIRIHPIKITCSSCLIYGYKYMDILTDKADFSYFFQN